MSTSSSYIYCSPKSVILVIYANGCELRNLRASTNDKTRVLEIISYKPLKSEFCV